MVDAFTRTVVDVFGEPGRRWLADLPTIVAAAAHDWQLEVGPSLRGTVNWVAPARRADGSAVVLKLGVPGTGHSAREATALEVFAGRGCVRILARDDTRGALLLERATPGVPVSTLVPGQDERATAALVGVLRELHRPAPDGAALPDLPTRGRCLRSHLRRHRGDDPLPRNLVRTAANLLDDLCATSTDRVVLHGDLHHDNVLSADRREWLAIDPHGVVGDPGYDVGALLYNPRLDHRADDETILDLLPGRVEQLADALGMPVQRVAAWGFVQAVLSEVWRVTDHGAIGGRPLRVALALLRRL
jgi:streptomycin 6-kinase